jgi:hypothetical protein
MRSANVSARLTETDAIKIWRRRLHGEAQHVIAADFGVNPGRIAEVLSGKRFPNARFIALAGNSDLTLEHKENNILQHALSLDGAGETEQD